MVEDFGVLGGVLRRPLDEDPHKGGGELLNAGEGFWGGRLFEGRCGKEGK